MSRFDEDRDPGLPIKIGRCSNGEFVPRPQTKLERVIQRRSRRALEENAKKVGMNRRQFMISSCGAATMLGVMNACALDAGLDGGGYVLPPEAAFDADAARAAIGGSELIFDVHTHMLEYDVRRYPDLRSDPDWNGFGRDHASGNWAAASCGSYPDPRQCFDIDAFVREVFLRSDTSVVALTHIAAGDTGRRILNLEIMERCRDAVHAALRCGGGDTRVVTHGGLFPTGPGGVPDVVDRMVEVASRVVGWKAYTNDATGHPAWLLDDSNPAWPAVGNAMLNAVESVGPAILCVHKGLDPVGSGDLAVAPFDVGPAAAAHPGVNLVIFHAGYQPGHRELALDTSVPTHMRSGIDRLIGSLDDHRVWPNENVYAELASVWRDVMYDPEQAAHVFGKLLLSIGEDNLLWGTDSIWYGTPQDQIQAFRAFEISEELQDTYGYPALTPERKAKILGLNAVRLFGINPSGLCPVGLSEEELLELRASADNRTYGPRNAAEVRLRHV